MADNVVIIGSGPAAHTAAIYAARANLNPILFEGFMAAGIAAEPKIGPGFNTDKCPRATMRGATLALVDALGSGRRRCRYGSVDPGAAPLPFRRRIGTLTPGTK